MLILKILYDQHSLFLSYKLHTNFLHLLTFILCDKNGKLLWLLCNSFGYLMSTLVK